MSIKKISAIIKSLLYLLALTPLIITPMTIFPFNFGRGLIMQFLIEIITGLFFILAVFDKNYRPKKNILTVLFALFLAVSFISSIFGSDFNRSFWSYEERFTGWFYLLHMFALLVVLVSFLKTKKGLCNFLLFNISVGMLMFAIAVLSLFGIKFWGLDLGTRIAGTLGNPIFLGAYFTLVLIPAGYLILNAENKKYKLFGLASLLIFLAGVFLTKCNGALLGLLAGLVVALVFYCVLNNRRNIRAISAGIIILLIISVVVLFCFKDSDFVKNNSYLERIISVSLSSGTGNTRLMGWKVALRAFKERPLLGWGMENFNVAFNKYYDPAFLKYSYYETWFDRPHNKILEVADDSGLAGLIAYLSIFGYVCFSVIKREKEKNISLETASLFLGGLAAYFVQNLFIFDTPVSYLMLIIVLFMAVFDGRFSGAGGNNESKKIPPAAFLSIVLVLPAAFYLNILPFSSSVKLRPILFAAETGETIDIEKYSAAMKGFNPYKEEWRAELVKNLMSFTDEQTAPYSEDELKFISGEANENMAEHSNNTYYHMLSGIAYGRLAKVDNKYLSLAMEEFDAALKLSPKRQQIYIARGILYGIMKDEKNLILTFEKAIALEPDAQLSYWEAGRYLYFLNPQSSLALEWMYQAVKRGYVPENKEDSLVLFKALYTRLLADKNYRVLTIFFENLIALDPDEPKWCAYEATVSFYSGEYNRAITYIKKAIALDESYRTEGEAFIRMIEEAKK